MSENNPGVLASHLADLERELDRWARTAAEARAAADRRQRDGVEQTMRAERNTRALLHHIGGLDSALRREEQQLEKEQERCFEARQLAQQTLRVAEETDTQAQKTLQHWMNQLDLARTWLERALTQLVSAEAALRSASSALSEVQWRLRSAEQNLRRKEGEGGASWSDKHDVDQARARVRSAEAQYEAAQHAVLAAQEEVARARARVACCEHAVTIAGKAVQQAQKAKQTAAQGLTEAERSVEHITAAQKAFAEAQRSFAQHKAAVDAIQSEVGGARKKTDEAQTYFGHVSQHDNAIQSGAHGGCNVLREKVDYLREADKVIIGPLERAVRSAEKAHAIAQRELKFERVKFLKEVAPIAVEVAHAALEARDREWAKAVIAMARPISESPELLKGANEVRLEARLARQVKGLHDFMQNLNDPRGFRR